MNEAINDCSKLVAKSIEALKEELRPDLPEEWNSEMNIKEVIDLLVTALDKLASSIGQ